MSRSHYFDPRTEKNLATLDPQAVEIFVPFIVEAKAIARRENVDYIAISGNRSWEEQDYIYASGRARPGPIVTKARGGFSNHNFGIALDFGAFRGGAYLDTDRPHLALHIHKEVGKIALRFGLEWGGWWRFSDPPHFEVKVPLTMAQKRLRYSLHGTVLGPR